MSALVVTGYTGPASLPTLDSPVLVHETGLFVQPAAALALVRELQGPNPRIHCPGRSTEAVYPASRSPFELLPVEIVNQVLSYLTYPRSRLPGLTQAQSAHDFPRASKSAIKQQEDLTTPPDTERWAVDLFSWNSLRHPFHTLSLTSRSCNQLIESYCAHKVRSCNKFNLPFAHLDKFGPSAVHPNLSGIVFRRLWLQLAPRVCVYCNTTLDCYPYKTLKRVIAACQDCFYRQTLTVDEVVSQYHISEDTIRRSSTIRGPEGSIWVLRVDVEALALQLYGTRAFHDAHPDQMGKPCTICAIVKFTPKQKAVRIRTSPKFDRRLVVQKRKSKRRSN